jgi:hypothetical protein
MSQGPEYGDASACLKITYSGDPARPIHHLFKMRAPSQSIEFKPDSLFLSPCRHLKEAAIRLVCPPLDLPGRQRR